MDQITNKSDQKNGHWWLFIVKLEDTKKLGGVR